MAQIATINRNTIYDALYSKLSGAAQFATKDQILQHWTDLNPTQFPYFALCVSTMTNVAPKRGEPPRWQLDYHAWIYVMRTNVTDVPAKLLNAVIGALEGSIAPDIVTGVQDLGLPDGSASPVSHCWLTGTIETDEGTLGQIAVAKMPISILAY